MRYRERHEEKEVDLAALIDIMANMIFFLMASVSFLQIKTLNAAVPALSSGPVSTGKTVDVSLEIKKAGWVLKAAGQPSDKGARELKVQKEIDRDSKGHLVPKQLMEALWEIKKVSPETKNIMIFPEGDIPFEEIVQTMDASREMPSIIDAKKRVPLFTKPVLTELVTGDEKPRDDVP